MRAYKAQSWQQNQLAQSKYTKSTDIINFKNPDSPKVFHACSSFLGLNFLEYAILNCLKSICSAPQLHEEETFVTAHFEKPTCSIQIKATQETHHINYKLKVFVFFFYI